MRVTSSRAIVAILTIGLGLFGAGVGSAQQFEVQPQPDAPPNDPRGMDVQARGPLHEAFAQPALTGSVDVLVVPKQPPDPIDEVPPEVKPEGEDVGWIPGYWAWDDERKDFLWVSGVWRSSPPGNQWVSGYWVQAEGGYRWVPGFWQPVQSQEVTYSPQPPESLEEGPTSPQPADNQFWIPGCWVWNQRYVWRPGYWSVAQPGWLWVPARYSWCPRGWVFTDGYWDYPLARRGLLFAPVWFSQPIWRQPHFRYRPHTLVDVGLLTMHLFARPRYDHYYFGDYYAPSYAGLGIYPWYGVREHRHYRYDPLFAYYRCVYQRTNPRWEDNLRGWHRYYEQHADHRPPHTFADLRRVEQQAPNRADLRNIGIVKSVHQVQQQQTVNVQNNINVQNIRNVMRLTSVSQDRLRAAQTQTRELRQLSDSRRKLELAGVAARPNGDRGKPDATPGKPGTGTEPRIARAPERVKFPLETAIAKPTPGAEKPIVRGQRPDSDRPERPDVKPGAIDRRTPPPPPKVERPTAKPENVPGKTIPGKTEVPRGKPDSIPGKADVPRGKPDNIPGKAEVPRGKPDTTPGKPDRVPGATGRPEIDRGSKPNVDRPIPQPKPQPDNPVRPKTEPRAERPAPVPRVADRPDAVRPQPDVRREAPVPERRAPVPDVRRDVPKPEAVRPQPEVRRETPMPERRAPAPEVRREVPKPEAVRPQPEVRREAPMPERRTPPPEVRREAPRPEPAPRAERPRSDGPDRKPGRDDK
jgi:hypothetical protein